MIEGHPALPRAGAAREALRERGQFWTPPWVADAMVSWLQTAASTIGDPEVSDIAAMMADYAAVVKQHAP